MYILQFWTADKWKFGGWRIDKYIATANRKSQPYELGDDIVLFGKKYKIVKIKRDYEGSQFLEKELYQIGVVCI